MQSAWVGHRVRVAASGYVSGADVVLDEVDRRPAPAQLRRRRADAAGAAGLVRVPRGRDRQQDPELDDREDEPRLPHTRIMAQPARLVTVSVSST